MAQWQDALGNLFGAPKTPSVYDVQRRQALAQSLLTSNIENQGPLGALANTINAGNYSLQSGTAANEAQQGQDAARQALAKALTGGTTDPAELLNAGGDPFLPQSESGLVGDLLKRKLGLGTVYGNNIPYMG